MENNRWVICDSKLIRASEPAVPVESRGLMYGEGCFETLRSYNGAFFKAEEHLHRLRQSSDYLGLPYPNDLELASFQKLSGNLLQKNDLSDTDSVIRIQIWNSGGRGYHVEKKPEVHFAITATSLPDFASGIALTTVNTRRIPKESIPSKYKLTNNINYITAARQAAQNGADDALMLTTEGKLSETTIANIFWVNGQTIYTPSESCDLLPGITRNTLIELVTQIEDFDIKEGEYVLDDIYESEAVWICNSLRHLIAVSKIDKRNFDPNHDLLKRLKGLYDNYVQSELKR